MIYILSGNYDQAKKWASSQHLSNDEWFCSLDLDELRQTSNFHVIVLESASELSTLFFEKLFNLAQQRGRINRQWTSQSQKMKLKL